MMIPDGLIIPKIYHITWNCFYGENNKSINIQIFYYYVFFKDQSF